MQVIRIRPLCLLVLLAVTYRFSHAQGTIPTFTRAVGGSSYTFAGHDPAQPGTTVIPTVLVPVALTFEGKTASMDAGPDVSSRNGYSGPGTNYE